jgi:hypothetical protein
MSDKDRLIDKQWLSYRRSVIPEKAPMIQITESRRAFFAGAQALLATIMGILEPGVEATPGDLATMVAISAELDQFAVDVKAGRK